jgi:phage/conjugal plasmid C-4 type zinc finger TraR family protein
VFESHAREQNFEESEMGQLHAIHLSENAIARVRAGLSRVPSLSHCIDCGEEIPEARRKASAGVCRCMLCQEDFERG